MEDFLEGDVQTVKKRSALKAICWVLGGLALVSFVCGVVCQELEILQEYNYLFIIGWAVGMLGILIMIPIYQTSKVVRTAIANKEVYKESFAEYKRQAAAQKEEWKQQSIFQKMLGWIILILFAATFLIGIIGLPLSGGHPVVIAVFAVCFISLFALAFLSIGIGAIQKRKKEDKEMRELLERKKRGEA